MKHFGYRPRFDESVTILLFSNPGNIGGKVIDYFYLPFCFRRLFGRCGIGNTFGFGIAFVGYVGFGFFCTLRSRSAESVDNPRCKHNNDKSDDYYDRNG